MSIRGSSDLHLLSISQRNLISFLYINQTDPDGYMTWLANELAKAEAAGDKVQIVGHIPPSEGDTFAAWTTNYLNVVNR